jgi:hypothetical protein
MAIARIAGCLNLMVMAAVLGGCAGADESLGTRDPFEGETFADWIVAATGGTVSTADNWTVIQIPAGALPRDAEVSITVAPPVAGSVTSTYECYAEGLDLLKPVRVIMAYDGDVGAGRKAALATLESGRWVPDTESSLADGAVLGEVGVLGTHGIILVPVPEVPVPECDVAVDEFVACGGDLTGSWRIVRTCPYPESVPLVPGGHCPEMVGTRTEYREGVLQIDASTVWDIIESSGVRIEARHPESCLEEGMSCEDQNQIGVFNVSCKKDGGDCLCEGGRSSANASPGPMDYEINGNELVLMMADGTEVVRYPYRVEGDLLYLKAPADGLVEGIEFQYRILVR